LGYFGYIHESSDILYDEIYSIYQDLIWTKHMDIIELVCYSDSLHCINVLKGPTMRYHVYAVLI